MLTFSDCLWLTATYVLFMGRGGLDLLGPCPCMALRKAPAALLCTTQQYEKWAISGGLKSLAFYHRHPLEGGELEVGSVGHRSITYHQGDNFAVLVDTLTLFFFFAIFSTHPMASTIL